MLFSPLTPFFVLFCHVVDTSSVSDFELLEEVVKGLSESTLANPAISGIRNILDKFVELCRPLILMHDAIRTRGPATETKRVGLRRNSLAEDQEDIDGSFRNSTIAINGGSKVTNDALLEAETVWSGSITPSIPALDYISNLGEDDIMAELYRIEPSLGCIEGPWATSNLSDGFIAVGSVGDGCEGHTNSAAGMGQAWVNTMDK